MILVNGQVTEVLTVHDRGLQYGDGLFETVAIRGSELSPLWERHMKRLRTGCRRLSIAAPDPALLHAEARQVCRATGDGVLKIIVTRGASGRGYRADATAEATRILAGYPPPEFPRDYRERGIALRRCGTRLDSNPVLAGIKHLNRLEQVLARSEWNDSSIAEGLMLDRDGNVIEGTMTNLFFVHDGLLVTPDVSRCGIDGVMRGHILDAAGRHGVAYRVTMVNPADVKRADEVFVCNSVIGIWPVRQFEEKYYPAGPITETIAGWLPF